MHLPLMEFDEGLSLDRLTRAVDAAREWPRRHLRERPLPLPNPMARPDGAGGGGRAVRRHGAGDDGGLVSLRGPVALAKTLALDVLSGGRVVAGVGPGSSERDYRAGDPVG